jgi:hypothetical protein
MENTEQTNPLLDSAYDLNAIAFGEKFPDSHKTLQDALTMGFEPFSVTVVNEKINKEGEPEEFSTFEKIWLKRKASIRVMLEKLNPVQSVSDQALPGETEDSSDVEIVEEAETVTIN